MFNIHGNGRTHLTRWILSSIILHCLLFTTSISAASDLGMDAPMLTVQNEFRKQLGCQWRGRSDSDQCGLDVIAGTVSLEADPTGRHLETVEITAVIATCPRRANDEARNRATVKKIVRHLLPNWKEAERWFDRALRKAGRPSGRSVTMVGEIGILVQRQQPADLCATYAGMVLTRKTTLLKDWPSPTSY